MRRLDPLNSVGIFLCCFSIYYGITSFIEQRNPNLNSTMLGVLVLFALGCMAVFLIHSWRYADLMISRIHGLAAVVVSLITVILLYLISYFNHLAPGVTIGTIIGCLAGSYLASGFRFGPNGKSRSVFASALIGVALFFLSQDCFFDVLTMGSDTLAPRVVKGQKVLVNKVAFGLRIPFRYSYITECGRVSEADLVVILEQNNQLALRKVLGIRVGGVRVNISGPVTQERLLGKAIPL